MKNFRKVLALVLVVATLLSFATMASADYKDQASIDAKYELAVDVLSGFGIISGDDKGNFRPNDEIDRDEVAKMVAVLCNGGEDIEAYYADACTFADTKNTWAAGYVAYCYHTGIIDGRNATTFDPNASITGYEVAKMLLCVLGFDADEQGYVGKDWKVNVLRDARNFGLLDDLDKSFNLKNNIKRQEVAQMILTALEKPVGVGVLSDNIVKITNAVYGDIYDGTIISIKDLGIGEFSIFYGNVVVSNDCLLEVYDYDWDVVVDCFGRPYMVWAGENAVTGKEWSITRPIAKGAAYAAKLAADTYVFINGEYQDTFAKNSDTTKAVTGTDKQKTWASLELGRAGLVVETYYTAAGTIIAAFETDMAVVTQTRKYQGVQQYKYQIAGEAESDWVKNTEGYAVGTMLYATYCDGTEDTHGEKLSLEDRIDTATTDFGVYFEKATPVKVKVTDVESTSKDAPAAWNKDNTVFYEGKTKYDYHEANYAGYWNGTTWNNTFFVAEAGATYNVYMNNGYAIAFAPYVAPDTATYGYAYFEGDTWYYVEGDKYVNGARPLTYYIDDMIDFDAKEHDGVKVDGMETIKEAATWQSVGDGVLAYYKVKDGVLSIETIAPYYAKAVDLSKGEIGVQGAQIVNSTKILIKVAGKYEAHTWASLKAKYGNLLISESVNVQWYEANGKVTYLFIEADYAVEDGYFFVVKWDRTRTSDQLPGGELKYVEQYSVVIGDQAAKLWIDSDRFETYPNGTAKEQLIGKLFGIKILYLGNTIDGEPIYYVEDSTALIEETAYNFDHIDSGKLFWNDEDGQHVFHMADKYTITVFDYVTKDGVVSYSGTKQYATEEAFNAEFDDNLGYKVEFYAEFDAAGYVVNLFIKRTAL